MTDGPTMALSGGTLAGRDLHLGYHGVEVVAGASIDLAPGRVTALVGPNGSGKSTLLRSLARLHAATSGRIVLDDDTSALDLSPKEFARRVTLLAQSRPTPSGVSVRDVVGYGRFPYRGRWRAGDPSGPVAVEWAMGVTGVVEMAERSVDELSGGELQRVWVATSLAQQTGVILLDEPTTFLDLAHQVDVLDLLAQLNEDEGRTVVLVLHDLNMAARYAHHLVAMRSGQITAQGPPDEVVTPALVAEVFDLECQVVADPITGTPLVLPVPARHRRPVAPDPAEPADPVEPAPDGTLVAG